MYNMTTATCKSLPQPQVQHDYSHSHVYNMTTTTCTTWLQPQPRVQHDYNHMYNMTTATATCTTWLQPHVQHHYNHSHIYNMSIATCTTLLQPPPNVQHYYSYRAQANAYRCIRGSRRRVAWWCWRSTWAYRDSEDGCTPRRPGRTLPRVTCCRCTPGTSPAGRLSPRCRSRCCQHAPWDTSRKHSSFLQQHDPQLMCDAKVATFHSNTTHN